MKPQSALTSLVPVLLCVAGCWASARTTPAKAPLVSFPETWTSPYRVDPNYPFHLINAEGKHLFILNKTAWLYFGCKSPEGVLDREGKSVRPMAPRTRSSSLWGLFCSMG